MKDPPLSLLQLLKSDARHYNYANGKRWYSHVGFWTGAVYRFGHWAGHVRFLPLNWLLRALYVFCSIPVRCVFHVGIPRQAAIGPGFCMHHPQNIVLPREITVGRNVTIYQEVTLGRGPEPGVPVIGDRVVIYAGAKILGGVKVGDDCEIGANVVVTCDIPPGCVVSVAPARAIPKDMVRRLRAADKDPR